MNGERKSGGKDCEINKTGERLKWENWEEENLVVGRIDSGDDWATCLPLTINVTAEIFRSQTNLLQKLVLFLLETHLSKHTKI